MKKRFLSLFLALAICLNFAPSVWAAEDTVVEVVPPKYDNAHDFSEGLAAVQISQGAPYSGWGFIDTTGKEVIPLDYNEAEDFSEGLAAVRLDGKWGFIDKTGKEVIPLQYDRAWNFSDGLACVQSGGKYGLIDKTGEEVVPCKYDYVSSAFSEDLAAVRLDGKGGFIDKTGKEVIPLQYDRAWNFSDGLAHVELDGKYGFIDKTGKEVVPLGKYDYVSLTFSEGLASVQLGDKCGFIDKTGKEVIPLQYDSAQAFSDGLAAVKLNGRWGFIDSKGNWIFTYYYTVSYFFVNDVNNAIESFDTSFSEGLATVKSGNKYGFIDKTGKEVIPCKYNVADNFSNGLARVYLNGKWGLIDKTGEEVVPCRYDDVGYFSDGLVRVCVDSVEDWLMDDGDLLWLPAQKWGFISLNNAIASTITDSIDSALAFLSKDTLKVDGRSDIFMANYKISGANYVQLRDIAMLLKDTTAQFSVDYDAKRKAVVIVTGDTYQPTGKELQGLQSATTATEMAIVSNNDIYVNGEKVDFAVYKINGSNYFKLRDLGRALGFNVGWRNATEGVFIESDKPYTDAD